MATGLALALGFVAWRVHLARTRPAMPEIPLEGAAPELVDAVNAAKARVDDDPHSAEPWGHLGDLLGVNGFHTQAIVCFSHAADLDRDNPRWPYMQANENLQAGRPREAIPLLQLAADRIRTRDESLTIRYALSGLLIEEGFLDEAAVRIREVASLDGEGDRSIYLRALLARSRGERDESRRGFERLLQSPAYARRAHRILAELSDPARSQQLLAAAEKLPRDAPYPDPFTAGMGSLRIGAKHGLDEYFQLMQQSPSDALAYLRHIARDASDSEIPFTLGQTLAQRGEWDDAADAFRHAVRLDSRNAQALMLLGEALEAKARTLDKNPDAAAELFEEAIRRAEAALRLQANLGQAHSVRGRALVKRKRIPEAIAAFHEAVTCQPESAAFHRELGEALAESGDVAAGLASLETAAKLAPEDARIRQAIEKWKK